MNLRYVREELLRLRQDKFAALLGVDPSSVSRWEKDPASIPFQVIQKIMDITGATFEQLCGKTARPAPLQVCDTWAPVAQSRDERLGMIRAFTACLAPGDDTAARYLTPLAELIRGVAVKPLVALVGHSDTGKSTLVNSLLGSDKMPVGWTPVTATAVYLCHIDDRPAHLHETVTVFAKPEESDAPWELSRVEDEAFCRATVLAEGGPELLKAFATREGVNENARRPVAAVVYLDAPLLRDCVLVDLPGYGTACGEDAEAEDRTSAEVSAKADAIIYLSAINGFMQREDVIYLVNTLASLSPAVGVDAAPAPLANLFVVASQAHIAGNGDPAELSRILTCGSEHLADSIGEGVWQRHNTDPEAGRALLRTRFFTYTTNDAACCADFRDALRAYAEGTPKVIAETLSRRIREYCRTAREAIENEVSLCERAEARRALLDEIERGEPERLRSVAEKRTRVEQAIVRCASDSRSAVASGIAGNLDVHYIASRMKGRGVRNRRASIEAFATWLNSTLCSHAEAVLRSESENFRRTAEEFADIYAVSPLCLNGISINLGFNAGDALRTAFTAALFAGLGSYVAASSIPVLTTAGVLPFVALPMLFNPVGLIVGLSACAALSLINLFGDWELRTAKKIRKAFLEAGVETKMLKAVDDYWARVAAAFRSGADKVERDWKAYVSRLRSADGALSAEAIRARADTLRRIGDLCRQIVNR